jgi:hypothetical protein
MASLQTQYKNFLQENPDCPLTFEEWKILFSNKLQKYEKKF